MFTSPFTSPIYLSIYLSIYHIHLLTYPLTYLASLPTYSPLKPPSLNTYLCANLPTYLHIYIPISFPSYTTPILALPVHPHSLHFISLSNQQCMPLLSNRFLVGAPTGRLGSVMVVFWFPPPKHKSPTLRLFIILHNLAAAAWSSFTKS